MALRLALALWGAVGVMVPAGALAETQHGSAKAVVVTSLSLLKVDDLDFGFIISGPTAGSVVVPPSGPRTKTGGVILPVSTFTPARFAGRGRQNQNVAISISTNTLTLNRVGGGATMTVNNWIIGSTPTAPITTAPLVFSIASANGIFNFPLGATLNVGANQRSGTYTGTFRLTLNYQ